MVAVGRQLLRNVVSSWMGYAARFIIAFFFIPYITSTLGTAEYGIWVIVFQALNFLTLFDFGLERALLRYVSRALGQQDSGSVNKLLSTATLIYAGLGALVLVAASVVGPFLFASVKASGGADLADGKHAFFIVSAYLAIRFWLLPYAASFGAFQRYDVANILDVSEELVKTALLVWLLATGHGLASLALAIFGTSLIKQGVGILWLRHLHPELRFSPRIADKPTARLLFDYSKISFGITLAWLAIYNSDSILLGLLASPAAAGIYAPGANVMLYLRMLVNTVGTPLIPAVSHLEGTDRPDAVRELHGKFIKYVSFFSFFMAAGVIMYARPFVALWLAPEYAPAARVMIILSVGTAFFLPHIIGNSVLFGLGKHRYLFWVLASEAVLKIGLSLALIGPYGPEGMAVAAAVPQVLIYVSVYPYLVARVTEVRYLKLLSTSLASGILGLLVTWPVAKIMQALVATDRWPGLAVNVMVVTAAACLVGYYVVVDRTDRSRLVNFLRGNPPAR
jgi:O-antigen/teichoic acid export membrane protein